MIKQLKPFPADPPPPRAPLPLCQATAQAVGYHAQEWRKQRYADRPDPMKCSRESVVEIEGCHYCRLHGGHKVLDMYLKGRLAPIPSAREEQLFQALLDIAEARVKNAASGFPILGADVARWMENRAQQEIDR